MVSTTLLSTIRRATSPLAISAMVLATALPTSANAAISLGDDAVFGTDAVIVDDLNDMEWLRLDFTTPYTYNEVLGALGTDFAGWTIASVAQLEALGTSAGIANGSSDPVALANAEQLRDWFCFTCVQTSSTHSYARGLVADADVIDIGAGPQDVQLAFSIGKRLNVTPNAVDFRVSGWYYPDGKLSPNEGIYLVRAVPEPETYAMLLAGLGLVTLASLRRRQAVTSD